jgi:hypothetical protein
MQVAAKIISLDDNRHNLLVESEPDPLRLSRTGYRITGTRECDVADYVASLVEEVAQSGAGVGNFTHPRYIGHGCYRALGEIILLRSGKSTGTRQPKFKRRRDAK